MRALTIDVVASRWPGVARILVGLAALPISLEWAFVLSRVSSGEYLAMPVAGVLPAPNSQIVAALFAATLIGAALLTLGLFGRLGAVLVSASSVLVLLLDQQTYSNHFTLLICLSTLIALTPCDSALSVRRHTRQAAVPYWPIFLIKLQISTVYLYTAVAKMNGQYLSGEVIGSVQGGPVQFPQALLPVVAVLSIVAELVIPIALWWSRTRLIATLLGVGLHVSILFVFDIPLSLVPFAMLMFAGYAAFWARREPQSDALGTEHSTRAPINVVVA